MNWEFSKVTSSHYQSYTVDGICVSWSPISIPALQANEPTIILVNDWMPQIRNGFQAFITP